MTEVLVKPNYAVGQEVWSTGRDSERVQRSVTSTLGNFVGSYTEERITEQLAYQRSILVDEFGCSPDMIESGWHWVDDLGRMVR